MLGVVNLAEDILDVFEVTFNMNNGDRENYCVELREAVQDTPRS